MKGRRRFLNIFSRGSIHREFAACIQNPVEILVSEAAVVGQYDDGIATGRGMLHFHSASWIWKDHPAGKCVRCVRHVPCLHFFLVSNSDLCLGVWYDGAWS